MTTPEFKKQSQFWSTEVDKLIKEARDLDRNEMDLAAYAEKVEEIRERALEVKKRHNQLCEEFKNTFEQ